MDDSGSLFFDDDEIFRGSADDLKYAEHINEFNARVDAQESDESVVQAEEPPVADETLQSLLSKLSALKDVGNSHFKAGDNDRAVEAYNEALTAAASGVQNEGRGSRKAQMAVQPTVVSLHCNAAAAHLKLEAMVEAVEAASRALALEPNHVKARYRRGVASAKLGRYETAKADLLAACRADPKDRSARDELARVQAALRSEKESARATFASRLEASAERECSRREAREAASESETRRLEQAAADERAAEFEDMRGLHASVQLSEDEQKRAARILRDAPLA